VLAVLVFTNYSLHLPVVFNNNLQHFLWRYCVYFFPYAFAFLLQFAFFPGLVQYKNRWFWFILLLAPLLFSLRAGVNLHHPSFAPGVGERISPYWTAIVKLGVRSLLLIIPVCFTWWVKDKDNQRLYGLNPLKNSKAFFILLALMVPIVIDAGLRPVFLETYPVVLKVVGEDVSNRKAAAALFELCYAFDFFSIEFFFRGFLIMAFTRFCGMHAILPAAVFYCCIHFDKPMPEAISSFFGGLLLGIISYHNKSIWGGLIIHIGIAWLMEIVALFHYVT
jgi:hypothetical protein